MHEKNGVKVHNNVRLQEVHSNSDGAVEGVTLSDGRKIDADLVILGTGVKPATKCLEGSGIELDKDGGVVCDPYLETNVKDVYAAGDIASYPYWATGSRARTEHWVAALDQGTNAAFNMLGKYVPY